MYYSLKQIKELKKHVEKTNNVKIKEDDVMVISNSGIYKMYANEIRYELVEVGTSKNTYLILLTMVYYVYLKYIIRIK